MTRPPARQERGFALLVIFLIAAAVAFTMYQELPRVSFESARECPDAVAGDGRLMASASSARSETDDCAV